MLRHVFSGYQTEIIFENLGYLCFILFEKPVHKTY